MATPEVTIISMADAQAWLQSTLPSWTEEARRVIAARPECTVLEAGVGSRVVGCAAYLPDPGGAELHYVGVDPNLQRGGIGTLLGKRVEREVLAVSPNPSPEVTSHTPHGHAGAGAALLRKLDYSTQDGLSWSKVLSRDAEEP